MKKVQLKLKDKQARPTTKHRELVEEEIIERIDSQIQVSTMDNLNYQREDNGNLIHISSITNPGSKSETSSLSKEPPNNNKGKDNDDSFIQKMSVNELEFNLKSIRSACKDTKVDEPSNNDNQAQAKNGQTILKSIKGPNLFYDRKRPVNQKANGNANNVSKEALNLQQSKSIQNSQDNNTATEQGHKAKKCKCSIKMFIVIFSFVLTTVVASVIIAIYIKL